ncbi:MULTISPECIES: hypothetical protein [Bacillus cereus group]|uniref:Uncharacterized protein n=1 Tax=Bacillus thuringiensis TaxID=1428 RepID=A0A9X7AS00_BACTU|nr:MULTISPECIES: hypothetical protein [Bacillus cereus group]PFT50796.1 hypothetical protein COK72_01975 [Bacillus thuringiensis]PFY22833.1 hypothetical protein COL44_18295 [Bacillus toyonensis]
MSATKKDKQVGSTIIYKFGVDDQKFVDWYNNQDNFSDSFRFVLDYFMQKFGDIDVKKLKLMIEMGMVDLDNPTPVQIPTPVAKTQVTPVQTQSEPAQEVVEEIASTIEAKTVEVTEPPQEPVQEPVQEVAEEVTEVEEEKVSSLDVPKVIKEKRQDAQPKRIIVEEKPVEVKKEAPVSKPAVMPSLGDLNR